MNHLRAWAPEIALGLVLAFMALLELLQRDGIPVSQGVPVAGLSVVAAVLSRKSPGAGLALVWLLGAVQLRNGTPLLLIEVSVAAVAFGCARWGNHLTMAASAISIPIGTLIGLVLTANYSYLPLDDRELGRSFSDIADQLGSNNAVVVILVVIPMLLLAVPWFAGLALRFGQRARTSEVRQVAAEEEAVLAQRERAQAQEIARLTEEQARLARDVHDVVGHSLAVILAQAESAQYLPDDDPARLKQTMATIATSARSSLQDVRAVLTPNTAGEVAPRPLDTLVDGVRTGGHEVVSRELGTPQPLPPELEVVAYRVLQEMLTNAVKHGSRDEPVYVERLWPDGAFAGELRLEVGNTVLTGVLTGEGATTDDSGRGLDGMRQRLQAVGGRLDVRRREAADPSSGATFTVTAWLPVSRHGSR